MNDGGWNSTSRTFLFDSYSMFLGIRGRRYQLWIGDFRTQFGQGLILGGAGFHMNYGSTAVRNTYRVPVGIRSYGSFAEHGFFRGIGFRKEIGHLSLSIFSSFRKLDAGITPDGMTDIRPISGLYRTELEISRKGKLRELAMECNWNSEISFNVVGGADYAPEFQSCLESSG